MVSQLLHQLVYTISRCKNLKLKSTTTWGVVMDIADNDLNSLYRKFVNTFSAKGLKLKFEAGKHSNVPIV